MAYEVKECSPKAAALIEGNVDSVEPVINKHHRTKYPLDQLHVGQCFTVPFNEASEGSLRITASKRGKDANKKFCVFKHVEFGCFEVARIG